MTLTMAKEYLEAGLPGFSFLMVWLSYKLLKNEQKRDIVRRSILRSTYIFMFVAFSFSILIASNSYYSIKKNEIDASHRAEVGQCRDGLTRLKSIANINEQNVTNLQLAIKRFQSECETVLEKLDTRKGDG